MSGSIVKRHAVGESTHLLGTLSDARRDIFLHQSLFEDKPPGGAVELTPAQTTTSTIKTPTNFQERCDMIEIGPELGASILSGLCDAGGCWERFLVDQTQSPVLRHTIATCAEELNLMAKVSRKHSVGEGSMRMPLVSSRGFPGAPTLLSGPSTRPNHLGTETSSPSPPQRP